MQFRECHQAIYPAHFQLLKLMDLMDAQGLHHHQYLKGSGLFYEDIASGNKYISALQFIRVIENAQKLGEPELAFRWGHALWPGHYDVFSQLLQSTSNLSELIMVVHDYSEMLCPLLKPIVINADEYVFIYWQDEVGVSSILRFLVEAYSTALLSLSHWLNQKKLTWRLGFSYEPPKYLEEYAVNLGDNVQFNMGVNLLALNHHDFIKPWTSFNTSIAIKELLRRQADQKYQDIAPGLIGQLTRWNQQNIQLNPSLDQAALAFSMSRATLKRKLKTHGTAFQRIQDQARLSICLYLLHQKKWSNQQVASYLRFSDANNFRKAFKRWCGDTPNSMREKLAFKARAIT